jgi:predicted lipase
VLSLTRRLTRIDGDLNGIHLHYSAFPALVALALNRMYSYCMYGCFVPSYARRYSCPLPSRAMKNQVTTEQASRMMTTGCRTEMLNCETG